MDGIWNRLLIWLCCAALLFWAPAGPLAIIAMLAAVTVSALNGYLDSRPLLGLSSLAFTILAAFWPPFCFFLPLVNYGLYAPRLGWHIPLLIFSGAVCCTSLPFSVAMIVVSVISLAAVLGLRTEVSRKAKSDLTALRDDSYEISLRLEQQNRELLEKQDYEVRLATMNERNRIAREIHDQVGHLLSRSILQIGALMVAESNPGQREHLSSVRDTLAQAMDSIRNSVHNLHEESVDLNMQMLTLAKGFLFCPIQLDYRIESEPDNPISYCFIAIVKEGLHNITRHSNATHVKLTLLEHPAFYQLILQDNGTPAGLPAPGGLGIQNMIERVQSLGGQILCEHQGGFRIFASVPKRGQLS